MFENLDRELLLEEARKCFRSHSEDDDIRLDSGATRSCVIFKKLGVVLKRDDSDFGSGYCERETFLYQKAKEYHVEQAFLPIEYFGRGWYIQPYADLDCWPALRYDGISSRHENKFDSFVSRMQDVDINPSWLHHLYRYYGWNFFKSFFHFCKRYRVNDLHSGNVGFINKKPIVYDYSGVPWKGRC